MSSTAAVEEARESLRRLGEACGSLYVYGAVLRTPAARSVRTVLGRLAVGDAVGARRAYARGFHLLAAEGRRGDAWRAHLAETVATDANPFTLAARPGADLLQAARWDLAQLQALADPGLWAEIRQRLSAGGAEPVAWRDLGDQALTGMAARLYTGEDWPALAPELAAHARAGGAGPWARHLAYRWRPADGGTPAALLPVPQPDLCSLEDLVGYVEQRQALIANTERFLEGGPALDVLLYGDRGTGKSSAVKGLLRRYAPRGLRLVELGRRCLPDLPLLCERLQDAPQRFVVFVDDLSFDEQETGYKDAKAALQGGVAARPANVVVYATSNRRHLVQERFSERTAAGAADDPRAGDAVEEKLSLADRFGLTLVFPRPDQGLYLDMVQHLVARAGLDLPPDEVRTRALRWAAWSNGPSGRTARQFVDALVASRPRAPETV